MPKCDFNNVVKELYGNHALACLLSCKFAEHPWKSASENANLISKN